MIRIIAKSVGKTDRGISSQCIYQWIIVTKFLNALCAIMGFYCTKFFSHPLPVSFLFFSFSITFYPELFSSFGSFSFIYPLFLNFLISHFFSLSILNWQQTSVEGRGEYILLLTFPSFLLFFFLFNSVFLHSPPFLWLSYQTTGF